jgi:hypothetical protein
MLNHDSILYDSAPIWIAVPLSSLQVLGSVKDLYFVAVTEATAGAVVDSVDASPQDSTSINPQILNC